MKDDFKIVLVGHVGRGTRVNLGFVSYDTNKFEDKERLDGKFPIRMESGVDIRVDESIDSVIQKLQTVKIQIEKAHRSCRQALDEGQTLEQWREHTWSKQLIERKL